MRVYLCGPMDWCSEEEASGWRDEATMELSYAGVTTLNPMDRPTFQEFDAMSAAATSSLVEDDKTDIEMADVLLVNYTKISVGTSMEVLLAWQKDKRVVIVAPEGMKLSSWLLYHSHAVFHTMKEAYDDIISFNNRLQA